MTREEIKAQAAQSIGRSCGGVLPSSISITDLRMLLENFGAEVAGLAYEEAAKVARLLAEGDEKYNAAYPPAVRARSIEARILALKDSLV